jgi:hypothetical protein
VSRALGEFQNFKRFSINITNPAYPDPYQGRPPAEFIVTSQAPNITVVANDMRQPLAKQLTAGVSQRLSEMFALHVDYVKSHTEGDYKVLDINPRNPQTGLRPLPQYTRIDQVRPDTDLKYQALYTRLEKRYSLRHQYMLSYSFTDSDDNNPMGRYIDPFDPSIEWRPSSGERRHAVVASGSVLIPWDITIGAVWSYRSQLPWSATAGRDLNGDTFNSDLVPGTTRNSGSRDLNLTAVNAWRALNNLAAISGGQIDTSRINLTDVRVSKSIRFGDTRKVDLMVQAFNVFSTKNLQAQFGGGRVGNSLSNTFGRITSARPQRQIELAARLNW